MIKVSVIGFRGFAAKHIELLKRQKDVSLESIYYNKNEKFSGFPITNDFNKVLDSDAVIIASPTPTHAIFLDLLKDYKGYILVEKPAVSSIQEIEVLRNWDKNKKSRIKVNFNLAFSELFSLLDEAVMSKSIGTLIFLSIDSHHGLSFKKGYSSSWRNKSSGVIETVGVHYAHMALKLFNEVESSRYDSWSINNNDDTGTLNLRMVNGQRVFIRCSYAAPRYYRVLLLGTNGYCEYDGITWKISHPRTTFDPAGRFIPPNVKYSIPMKYESMVMESLFKSHDYFFNTVRTKGKFPDFDLELKANALVNG